MHLSTLSFELQVGTAYAQVSLETQQSHLVFCPLTTVHWHELEGIVRFERDTEIELLKK